MMPVLALHERKRALECVESGFVSFCCEAQATDGLMEESTICKFSSQDF